VARRSGSRQPRSEKGYKNRENILSASSVTTQRYDCWKIVINLQAGELPFQGTLLIKTILEVADWQRFSRLEWIRRI
jgi:hypothetical protein